MVTKHLPLWCGERYLQTRIRLGLHGTRHRFQHEHDGDHDLNTGANTTSNASTTATRTWTPVPTQAPPPRPIPCYPLPSPPLPFMQQNTTHPAVFQALPNKMPNVIFRRHCRKRQQLFTHALERSRWRSNSGCRDVPEIPNLHEWLWLAECECRRKTDG